MPTPSQQASGLLVLPALFVAALVSLPIIVTLLSLAQPAGPIWEHLRETVLNEYLLNTLLLMLLTGGLSLLLGVSTGWLIGACQFRGRATLSWLLMLPLASPAYIVAYVYTDLLEVSGPVQTTLRSWLSLGINDLQFPPIRNLTGAAVLLSLVLYPYIYLLCRNSFAGRSGVQFDAARVLGHGPFSAFFRVALPAARPAIVGGLALVLMETLADFGVVSYFSVPTFSTGIFRTWLGLGDPQAALKLASLMLLFVIVLVGLEETNRRGAVDRSDIAGASQINLTGVRAFFAIAACVLPIVLGFVIPAVTLALYAADNVNAVTQAKFTQLALNSLLLAMAAGVGVTLIAWVLAYVKRLRPSPFTHGLIRVSTLGYALPGILLAVALLKPVGGFDTWLMETWSGLSTPLLSGSLFLLLYAYVCRFLTVAYQSVDSGFAGISHDIDAAARTLGTSTSEMIRKIHFPLLRPSIFAACLLVFVDVMRELPATLILRPFNFDTLATQVYRLASDERLAEASGAALLIVILGVLPVVLLQRTKAVGNRAD
jgi:iron(III) transport system permease protein